MAKGMFIMLLSNDDILKCYINNCKKAMYFFSAMAAVVYYAYETAKIACILLANNSVKSSHLLCFGSICLRNMNV